jgi:hypothetical protein
MLGSYGVLNDGREKPVDKVERFAWIKSIDSSGKISHINWERFYESVAVCSLIDTRPPHNWFEIYDDDTKQ